MLPAAPEVLAFKANPVAPFTFCLIVHAESLVSSANVLVTVTVLSPDLADTLCVPLFIVSFAPVIKI